MDMRSVSGGGTAVPHMTDTRITQAREACSEREVAVRALDEAIEWCEGQLMTLRSCRSALVGALEEEERDADVPGPVEPAPNVLGGALVGARQRHLERSEELTTRLEALLERAAALQAQEAALRRQRVAPAKRSGAATAKRKR